MASDVFQGTLDIHTGGVGLKLPHHDNEIAQSEAHFDSSNWVNYFLHTGHLTIAGCKMSKSLKNFITIKEALKKHTSTQIRFAFLLHSWKDTLDYSDNTMEIALKYEKMLNEFFLNVKDILRQNPVQEMKKFGKAEMQLCDFLFETKKKVRAALADNIDTRGALDAIRDLISISNIYVRDNKELDSHLLEKIGVYITDLVRIFGAIRAPKGSIGFPLGGEAGSDGVNVSNFCFLCRNFVNFFAQIFYRKIFIKFKFLSNKF
jgi:cysteinyl-tRNA synthetase